MKSGGFDAVIGNPPYIPIETMANYEREYFQQHYAQLERKYDSSIIFILAGLQKLRLTGYLGFISSITWETGENFRKLREYLFTQAGVEKLVNLPFDVFKDAYVDTGIYILSRAHTEGYSIYRFPKKDRVTNLGNLRYTKVPPQLITPPDYKVVLEPQAQSVFVRLSLDNHFVPLGSFTISTQGLAGNRFPKEVTPRGDDWFPFLEGGQVYRYILNCERESFVDMRKFPSLKIFYESKQKLLVRRVINRQDRLMATMTDRRLVFKKDINPFILTDPAWNALYVLGILNSRLLSYLYVNTSSIATKDDFRQTTLAELRRLPFPNPAKVPLREKDMVQLVKQMLLLNKELTRAKTPDEKTKLERQIAATDRQIDQLVYELYGLTEEEIKIVEDATIKK